ncbi:catalytic phage domain protein : Integrase, catalytic core, phage domain protein OS=Rhodopirellula sallentina SM41 GN=RSSM_06627 PE=4 SV=1: Phage_integrase [Gemmata massiliana]|uniref:Tyr recombinase domain-containing protein n=1 Tax=Gemmata massiliana TaxID=1210884 RepID=A0A6P2CWL7_9BACT|nr:site-specific integrase [Gemmata massiliana]VTR92786.1 catalytic phage domain protein : Integrase, catalytic core, phage domain protein OS=Rhodopirellula sallentina SM41 GN=RSSM_06627 PE=4 SV=1: Phage_integrase [Gemmata massiliana]
MPNLRKITFEGQTLSLTHWSKLKKIPVATIASRLKAGWSVEDALTVPVDRRYSRGGGRRAKDAGPRPCPEMKKHPTTGQAYCRWHANGKDNWAYFGEWGSPEASRKYRRFSLEWAAGGVSAALVAGNAQISDLVTLWIEHCARTYVKYGKPTSEVHCNRSAMRHMNELYGDIPAELFTVPMLRAVREAMIAQPWARKTVNDNVARIIRAFGWAAGEGIVPQSVHQGLELIDTLAAGRRDDVVESEPVDPVPEKSIEAVLDGDRLHPTPKRRAVLVAMIRTQLSAGLRPGELCGLCPEDLDRSQVPWRYEVVEYNKMLHKDVRRVVFFGPRARASLDPLLSVCAAGEKVFRFPPWRRGAAWTPVSVAIYRGRIAGACEAAKVPIWTPNQLRHNRATEVMDIYESDQATAAVLGNTPEVARQIYAHRAGESVARRIAEQTG